MKFVSRFFINTYCLAVVILLTIAPSTYAYASWIKCFVELNDPHAVIMHHHITSAEQARVNITLQAWVEIPSVSSSSSGANDEVDKKSSSASSPSLSPGRKKSLPTQRSDNGTIEYYLYHEPGTLVQLKLDSSNMSKDMKQRIQYVVDIVQPHDEYMSANKEDTIKEKAHFIPPQDRRVVCKGRRAIGSSSNVIHTLALHGDSVEIVAGWVSRILRMRTRDKVTF